MRERKKLYLISILSFVIFIAIGFIVFINKAYSAGTTIYHDWSAIDKINDDYSYSTLFMTDKTTIEVIKDTGDKGEGDYLIYRGNIMPGNEFIALITNCATNKNGELLDVLVKINNVKKFSSVSSGHVSLSIGTSYRIPKSQNDPSTYDVYSQKVNQPLVFAFNTSYAQADFSMTYYKAGTYNDKSDTGELGNISSVSGIYWDFDIYVEDESQYRNELFSGEEGVVPHTPSGGESHIYYNKNKRHGSSYVHNLKEESNGIAIDERLL